MTKRRLDLLLTEKGIIDSREKARALIMSGEVFVDGQRCDKPGTAVFENANITVRQKQKYVSRGGYKLEKAAFEFCLDFDGLICADIGASTGGFTDYMIKNGAKRVYSVDVGYGQLGWELRNDRRVINIERKNARNLTERDIPEKLDFFCADVSFISLKLVLPATIALCGENFCSVCLIKPQFEAGREKVGKNGIIKDKAVQAEVVEGIVSFVAEMGFSIGGVTYSPIKGPEGNIEFLLYFGSLLKHKKVNVLDLVCEAHDILNTKE